ncbi:MAG: hypothetical protein N0E59_13275 [Candidatus Thiodiazotropha taylori]|uniref:Uncharacterized protein n=1 Tax=Candidatus Thiodiazotropha taylori TaxID=2792791 RepID=A0A9E4KBZ4_9GAMM|nr:hypothetical protein [Candidatus Thiodiazotropha taylori]RLW62782.1 MAG: hypothetical protein B6D73_17860 [gamma proteobacterium symbiont of Stewartia floridana]MCG7893825.1 hypothetical protein [Candidatus Thiodiazotropha taylori]MCG7906112.1 hypothetical protein [Candidatus Thiodiazotropha taylori]MCG7909851.1 hypothetical protein [Candidatus Thiodiazotropha taylori]
MALKKTVKKRRRAKRKVVSMEAITEALQADINLSAANKRALSRLSKAEKALERQDKMLATNSERVAKARAAVSSAKTPASKAKAKERLSAAQDKLKQVKADRTALASEQGKAVRLAKGLYKAMQSARAKMMKDFEKSAKALEKAVDSPRRRRRRAKKKVAAAAD